MGRVKDLRKHYVRVYAPRRRLISIADMHALTLEGFLIPAIAQRAGISEAYARMPLKNSQVRRYPTVQQTQRRKLTIQEMCPLEVAGLTHQAIAERADISVRQVSSAPRLRTYPLSHSSNRPSSGVTVQAIER